jgi:hypothetical protein
MAVMADQPSPRRRLQFRLRTLLFAITVACIVAVIWRAISEARTARGRVSLLETIKKCGGEYQQHLGGHSASLIRHLCGDQCVVVIWRPHDLSGPSDDEIRAWFPKVQILVASDER